VRKSVPLLEGNRNVWNKRGKAAIHRVDDSDESDLHNDQGHLESTYKANDEASSKLCSRLIPYDSKERLLCCSNLEQSDNNDMKFTTVPASAHSRNLRQQNGVKRDSAAEGRAARANQRRMLKDKVLAAKLLSCGMMMNREPHLRFGRSKIHAWGVFAEEPINKGDMIIEYRGEVIGIAVSNIREMEYERSKVGSDYMFRIDSFTVCDATKQGNMARFINASCDPNCYTKIINVMDTKRIFIYAKRNIMVGEELCYDYKFQLESDEMKRIPCYCGAKKCKGFMNWVSKGSWIIFSSQPFMLTIFFSVPNQ
jgi:histone-lysine N-methyltransferase SETD1